MDINLVEKLLIVRHGPYDDLDEKGDFLDEPTLSKDGAQKVLVLLELLRAEVASQDLLIVSSTALRATQTAQIIADGFGMVFYPSDLLWTGEDGHVNGFDEDFIKAMEFVASFDVQAKTVMLVTHHEYAKYFPQFWGRRIKTKECWGEDDSAISTGTAWLIDCVNKTRRHIKPK